MPKRNPLILAAAGLVLGLAGTLTACATPVSGTAGSPQAPASSATIPASHSAPAPTPVSASASAPPSVTATASPSPPPVAGAPMIRVVRLGAGFSPKAIQLGVGQRFEVIVSKTVKVSGLDCTSGNTGGAVTGLSVRCASGNPVYTAEHTGTTALTATVRPRCPPGSMCPQWISEATLTITVT